MSRGRVQYSHKSNVKMSKVLVSRIKTDISDFWIFGKVELLECKSGEYPESSERYRKSIVVRA